MEKDFVIDKASWHTQKVRTYEFDNSIIYEYFRNIFKYLEENGLTTRKILPKNNEVNDDTCLSKSDLTEEGLALVRLAYEKWIDKVVDKKIHPTDHKILDRALKTIRSRKP